MNRNRICQACERGHHEDCGGQVSAANSPCDCGHCWGPGGSEAAHAAATRHWSPIMSANPKPTETRPDDQSTS